MIFYVTLLLGPSVYIDMKPVIAISMDEEIEGGSTIADFETWMKREQRRVYLLCLRLLRNSDEADSAVQDVFIKAFRALQRPGGKGILEPTKWLTRVAVNVCADRINSRRWMFWRHRIPSDDEQRALKLIPDTGRNQENVLIEREKLKKLYRSLGRLSTRQRLVFVMRHDEGRSVKEIAEILRLDEGTVKAHMARAVKKLRGELRDLYAR